MIWRQFDIDLGPRPEDAAGEVFARMQPALDAPRTGLWFVRKPPGLRLRARADVPERDMLEEIVAGLRDDEVVVSVREAVYEPEARRFGGARAMELVHAFFHVDTRGFVAWDRRRAGGRLSPTVVSVGVLSTLFARLLADAGSEIWDAWANLAALHGIGHRSPAARPLPLPTVLQLRAVASDHESDLLAEYHRGCCVLAEGVEASRRDGGFQVGLRAFAADVALFHWNRWGIAPADRIAVCEGALAALDPHRRLPFP